MSKLNAMKSKYSCDKINIFMLFQARINGGSSPSQTSGFLRGWSLVLHGTRAPPYAQLQPQDPHSKLAVVKKAHEDNAIKK